jgi:AcrR family transcriptional regulator
MGSNGDHSKEALIATKPDRRPERTRQALVRSLVELILERGYESVTIDDLTQRANVGRSTLYVHFGGLDGVLKQALTNPSIRLADIVDRKPALEHVAALLDHFKDQRKRNGSMFAPPMRAVWVRRLAELIEPRLEALASAENRPAPLLPLSFIATQLAEQQLALVANWLSMRVTMPSEAVAAAVIAMTRATVDGLAPGVAE